MVVRVRRKTEENMVVLPYEFLEALAEHKYAKRFSNNINTNLLTEELQTALEHDRKYWLQNDAKIKACTTSKNYDEFREYVAAAHLAPLNKADKEKKCSTWNTMVNKHSSSE